MVDFKRFNVKIVKIRKIILSKHFDIKKITYLCFVDLRVQAKTALTPNNRPWPIHGNPNNGRANPETLKELQNGNNQHMEKRMVKLLYQL
jgi:hypothetical protein